MIIWNKSHKEFDLFVFQANNSTLKSEKEMFQGTDRTAHNFSMNFRVYKPCSRLFKFIAILPYYLYNQNMQIYCI